MSISLRRVQSLNILQNLQFSSRNVSCNLKRDISLLSISNSNLAHCSLLSASVYRTPSRTYHKHEVEVFKRIQWKRPVKVPCILPEKSGDLSGLPKVDLNEPAPLFKESPEYQRYVSKNLFHFTFNYLLCFLFLSCAFIYILFILSASESLKRILSIDFLTKKERRQAKIDAMTHKVKRHKLDSNSVEVKGKTPMTLLLSGQNFLLFHSAQEETRFCLILQWLNGLLSSGICKNTLQNSHRTIKPRQT